MGAVEFVLFAFSALVLYYFAVRPVFLSPLFKVPKAHFSSPISSAWILWQRIRRREIRAIHAAHERYGPIVRLAPDQISINCVVGGLKTIYGGFEKTAFYRIFENYEKPNMFSTMGSKEHAERKRPLGNLYSKSYLQGSSQVSELSQELLCRLVAAIDLATSNGEPTEVVELSYGVALDFVSAYLFGIDNCSDFLRDAQSRKRWVSQFIRIRKIPDWPFDFPLLTYLLSCVGVYVTPRWADEVFGEVNDICLRLMRKVAIVSNNADRVTNAVVYNQLMKSSTESEKPSSAEVDLGVASELMDHINAGGETTAGHPNITPRRSPLTIESIRISSATPVYQHPSLRTLDALPVLDSIVIETLRLHTAVPGPQPRYTPPSGTTLAGYFIPGGIKVSAQAYSLHRSPQVFPDPTEFRPDRWLNATEMQRGEMMRWFWGFGSGTRGCIGKEFAMMGNSSSLHCFPGVRFDDANLGVHRVELKLILGAIYSQYSTHLVGDDDDDDDDDDGTMEQVDSYSAGPKGDRLLLKFERLEGHGAMTAA